MRAAAEVAGVATWVTIATTPPGPSTSAGMVQEGELGAKIETVDATGEHDPAEHVTGHQAEMVQHLGFPHLESRDPGLVREGGTGLHPVGVGATLDDRPRRSAAWHSPTITRP